MSNRQLHGRSGALPSSPTPSRNATQEDASRGTTIPYRTGIVAVIRLSPTESDAAAGANTVTVKQQIRDELLTLPELIVFHNMSGSSQVPPSVTGAYHYPAHRAVSSWCCQWRLETALNGDDWCSSTALAGLVPRAAGARTKAAHCASTTVHPAYAGIRVGHARDCPGPVA